MLSKLKISQSIEKTFKSMRTGQFFLIKNYLMQKVYDGRGNHLAIKIEDGIPNLDVAMEANDEHYPIVDIEVIATVEQEAR